MGFWPGAAVVAASMIGTGILVTPGYTAAGVGSHTIGLWLWVLGGVLALCGSLTIAEMATAMPKVGGEYVYVRKAWGDRAAFVYGWATVLLGFAGPTAVVALNAAGFLKEALVPWNFAALDHACFSPIAASAIVAAFTAVHCLGQRQSGAVQTATTAFKYGTLIVFTAAGLWFGLSVGSLFPNLLDRAPIAQDATAWTPWFAAAASLVYIKYTYIGWNATTYIAGEIRDPDRLLPRSLLVACAAVTLLYLAMVLAFAGAFSATELAAMRPAELDVLASAAAERYLPGPFTKPAFSAIVGVGLLATVSAFLLSGSRVLAAMAAAGHFPAFAGRWNPRTHTPTTALLTIGVAALGICWFKRVGELLELLGVGLTALGLLFGSSLFLLRRQPDYRPTFRTPFYPLPTLLYLSACVFIVAMNLAMPDKRTNAQWGLGVVCAGFPLYHLLREAGAIQRQRDDQNSAEPRQP